MKSKRFDFSIIEAKLKEAKQHMPDELANMSLKFFDQSFKKQGFEDNIFQHWKERKKKDKRNRKILIKSGALRRSIMVKYKSFNKIIIGSYLPYSRIHNEGGTIKREAHAKTLNFHIQKNGKSRFVKATSKRANFQADYNVGAYTINMPKRQFMGNSARLRRMQEDKILKMIKRAFQ